MNAEAVQAMIAAGQIRAETKLWTQGMAGWDFVAQFPEFHLSAPNPTHDSLPTDKPVVEIGSSESESLVTTEEEKPLTATQKKKRWEDDIVLPPQATQEQIRQADEFIRQARIAKMRGSSQEYTRLLNQAQQVAPGAPNVLEALGDDLLERNNQGEARVAYYKAHKMAPKNVQIERKYAELVFQSSANKSWETQMMLETEAVANAKYAAVLSAIVPGVGQIVLQDRWKGGVMATIWFFSIVGIVVLRNDVQNIIRMLAGRGTHPSPVVYFLLFVFIVNWIVSVMDCINRAKGKGDTAGLMAYMGTETPVKRDKKERPIPPENLPFE